MATASLLGLPAGRLVYGDTVERTFWELVTQRAVEMSETQRDNLARAIANEMGDLLRRMFRRRGPRRA